VSSLAFSPDGKIIVSGSYDNTLRVWNIESGEYLCGIYTEGTIYDIKWHPDGERIVAAGAGGVYFLKLVR
jgi:WD40 repeat protein